MNFPFNEFTHTGDSPSAESTRGGTPVIAENEFDKVQQSKYARATLEQKIMVLDWHHTHSTCQQQTVAHFAQNQDFSITKSSFNRWIKEEDKLREAFQKMSSANRAQMKSVVNRKSAGVDKCLEKWWEQKLFDNTFVSEKEIGSQWFRFERLFNPDKYVDVNLESGETKSNGWIHHFKKRMKVKKDAIMEFVNDQIARRNEFIVDEKARIARVLSSHQRKDVFHLDEFIVTDRIVPVGARYTRYTIGVCTNADGSEILDPLIVSHGTTQLEKCVCSPSGLDADIVGSFLSKWDVRLGKRKVVLVLDTWHEHVLTEKFKNISIVWLDKAESPLKHVVRWFKLEFKSLLLKHQLVEWRNYRRVKAMKEEDLVTMLLQVYEFLKNEKAMIRKSWLISDLIGPHNMTPWIPLTKQEDTFGKLLQVAQSKKIVDPFALGFDELLFPPDEIISNRHLSDQEIVALVKISERVITPLKQQTSNKRPLETEPVPQLSFEPQQIKRIDQLIHHDLNPFFQQEKAKIKLPRSSAAFHKFWNEYVSESMQLFASEHDSTALPELANTQ